MLIQPRHYTALLTLALLTASAAAQKLVGPRNPADVTPKLDLSLGFSHMQANAPPGISDDFGLNGGNASVAYHFDRYLAAAAEFTGGHANNISSLGQGLTLFTYTAGPRVTYYGHRVEPFGQALFGYASASDSYFPLGTSYTTTDSGFAYSAGGGVDINLSHRFAIRALEAQFLHTPFRNGASNVQRHLLIGAGVVLKFGGRVPVAPPPPPAAPEIVTRPRGDIHFSCSLQVRKVVAGEPLRILGETMTEPDHLEVMYTWMPEAGMIVGSGREVVLNTTGLPPGSYEVRGHAAVLGDYAMSADCELPFEIAAPPAPVVAPPPPPAPPPTDEPRQREFHTNVPDAYFDYNTANLRPDARAATAHAADYLNQHPDMRVRVEGFADERGSVEYNLMLGQQRAEAARGALIAAGVDASRVEIISFGKADPVCAQANETCYRQNRRAAFSLHP